MLYVRFLSSLSPPLDTFATLSKVYRPSQTPHPAMSSKDMGRRGRVPHNRIPRGFLHVLPPYRRPTLLTEFRVAPPFRRSFNRMKLIETPQPPSCAPHWEARSEPPTSQQRHIADGRSPCFSSRLIHLPPSAPRGGRSTQEREGQEKGGFPSEGFLGPGGMRKRFALAALRSRQPS